MAVRSMKPVLYSKTARDHIVFYRFPIEVLEDRIGAEEWVRIKENVYRVEVLRKGAVFTVRFAEYPTTFLYCPFIKPRARKRLES